MPPKRATTTPSASGPGGTDGTGRSTAPGAGIGVNVEPDPSTTVPETTETAGTTAGTTAGATRATSTGNRETTVASFEALGFTKVIAKIIWLCDFPEDSSMVEFIRQQNWTKLFHVTTIGIDEVKDFFTVRSDGNYEAKPMMIHLRMFKCFLLYYKRKCRDLVSTLGEDYVIGIMTRSSFYDYCGSDDYAADVACGGCPPITGSNAKGDPSVSGIGGSFDSLTVQEFRRGVKRDKTHYENLKDDKYFNTWNRSFVATAHMHHTQLVLDETYVPKADSDVAVFKEMQTFMYAVLEEHLKTDKGRSLVSQYEMTRDAQSIYRELKKHALSSTAAQLSGDTLLQYVTTARFPGNWRGTAYGFVLHWKE